MFENTKEEQKLQMEGQTSNDQRKKNNKPHIV